MHLDYFTLAALAQELRASLMGARLQKALACDEWAIGLEWYGDQRRQYLYLSAENQQPRLQLFDRPLRRGPLQPPPLIEYLRRHAIGARLRAIEQPPWERLLRFRLQAGERELSLIAEPMPRRANLLLVEAGVIRECLRRVGPAQNRYRLSLPGHRYRPPPPQTKKRPPWPIDENALREILSSAATRPLAAALSARLLAISPLLAREICQRANTAPETPAREAEPAQLRGALAELIPPLLAGEYQAGLARPQVSAPPLAFSVYPLRHLPGWQRRDSLQDALAEYYGAPTGPAAYEPAKAPLRAAIAEARKRLKRRRDALERGLPQEDELQRLRLSGQLILAYQHQIAADQRELRADYDADEPPLAISLQADLSPLENAQAYFRRYEKAKRAIAAGPQRLAELDREYALLEQIAADLLLAENWPEIEEARAALAAAGHLREQPRPSPKGARSGPRRLVCDGYIIWLGRNLRQNAAILQKHSKGADLWLHARGVPGAHVVIRNDGRRIPESLIEKAARLAAHYSARRQDAAVAVDITERRQVRSIPGGAPGLVRYRGERTLHVAPHDETLFDSPTDS